MGREIDIRIMNLNKWYVPKSFSMDELEHPVVLGYFDALQVREMRIDQEVQHPFIAGYSKQEESKKKEKKSLVDYNSQEQMLFLNICHNDEEEDGLYFKRETVEKFWSDQDNPYIFLSMIHINHSGKLKQALRKIKEVFDRDYLSYISMDYCDIVLFTHNMQINTFMTQIKRLFEAGNGKEAVIFDTFSMVSFQPHFVNKQDWDECGSLYGQENVSEFQATINLSIRDYDQFKQWYKDLQYLEYNITRYNMFGRHDVSIVNEHANTTWLMQVMGMLHNEKSRAIFWTFETYIKITDKDNVIMMPDEPYHLNAVYTQIMDKLMKEIEGIEATKESKKIIGLEEIIKNSGFRDESRYLLPIYEVRDCICSIVKNSFAEEFIYCIYESFLHFISYIKKEILSMSNTGQNPIEGERKIAKEYDNYFTALNTLVNSTMHNERQFVQATAFNAVLYSVPPKIMAFYNAYIYRIKQVLRDTACNEEYTFLIYPSFSPMISVEQISLDDNLLFDRLLTVRISEKSLYDIESVMYQFVHEVAHYVGNSLRCRTKRKEKIINTLVKYIVAQCGMEHNIYEELLTFAYTNMGVYNDESSCDKMSEDIQMRRFDYLKYMNSEGKRLIRMLEDFHICHDFFEQYYKKKVNKEKYNCNEILEELGIDKGRQLVYIDNFLSQYCDYKCIILQEKLEKMNSPEELYEYENYIELLKSAYSESYADLQMILVLAMDAEDYLNTFFEKQNVPFVNIISDAETMLRISTIYKIMNDCSIWKDGIYNPGSRYAEIMDCIRKYNHNVEKEMETVKHVRSEENIQQIIKLFEKYDFRFGIRLKKNISEQPKPSIENDTKNIKIVPYVDAAIGLYEYLLEVMKESLEEYTKPVKQKMIQEVRQVVGRILDFKDTTDIFNCIEAELEHYKQEGCKIKSIYIQSCTF